VARAFGSYATRLIVGDSAASWWPGVFSAALVAVLALINAAGTGLVAKTELAVVAAKLAVLAAFVIVGAATFQVSTLTSHPATSASGIFGGIAVAFFAYTGFGVITNAAADLSRPRRDLPRALFGAIGIVILLYLAIVVVVLANLTSAEVLASKETALAEAARPVLGSAGFSIMAIAAMLSTASSVNANLFGVTNRAYTLAKYGELPETFERRLWHQGTEGLVLVSAAVILMATFLDLSALAGLASAAALVIYLTVNVGHLRLLGDTGASRTLVVLAVATSAAATALFFIYAAVTDPLTLVWLGVAFALSIAAEAVLQRRRSGHIHPELPRR
jgi:amino acid transporter